MNADEGLGLRAAVSGQGRDVGLGQVAGVLDEQLAGHVPQ